MLTQRTTACAILLTVILLTLVCRPAISLANQAVVVDFGKKFDVTSVGLNDATASLQGDVLRMDAGHKDSSPGIVLKAPDGHWNLSLFHELAVHVRNVGTTAVTVGCRAENADSDGAKHCSTGTVVLAPGERSVVRVTLTQALPPELRSHLIAMRGIPLGMSANIDSSKVTQMVIFVVKPTEDSRVELSNPLAWNLTEPNQPINERELFPMIDTYGQFMHKDWPGKTHSLEDLAANKKAEEADLAANPGPKDWDQYGGWKGGPQLKATGFFRTEKHKGKWWLVDPEGRLFWSQGITCVGWGEGSTPITDRKHWFADLPATDSPFAQFYSKCGGATINYYKDKPYDAFDFLCSNLLRKYGDGWKDAYPQLAHQRLRSWGMNTIAMWSASEITKLHKTPFIAGGGLGGRSIEGSQGYWGKFVDVFDPGFVESADRLTIDKALIDDPWCLGFFMDNELCWGDELSLALATLRSPADQPAKKVFLADLQKKHKTIEKLNAAWGVNYASWDAMLQSTALPNEKKAKADLLAFDTRLCNRYFEVCSGAIKRAAPNHMYMGCRFSRSNEPAVRAAGKYCDVVSFNRYQYTLADMRLPKGIDKPVIVGEFHFGAVDRGMFNTGLCPTVDQDDRAKTYRAYVRSALDNACVVGAHYFEYTDQATTGRGDMENYQIGFVDTCDTPYPEIIQAAREIGSELYRRRSEP